MVLNALAYCYKSADESFLVKCLHDGSERFSQVMICAAALNPTELVQSNLDFLLQFSEHEIFKDSRLEYLGTELLVSLAPF